MIDARHLRASGCLRRQSAGLQVGQRQADLIGVPGTIRLTVIIHRRESPDQNFWRSAQAGRGERLQVELPITIAHQLGDARFYYPCSRGLHPRDAVDQRIDDQQLFFTVDRRAYLTEQGIGATRHGIFKGADDCIGD